MRKKSLLFTLVAVVACLSCALGMKAQSQVIRGDVNCDGFVTIDDVTALINYLLTDDATGIDMSNADTNIDEQINITDVTVLINYLLTDCWPEDDLGYETFTVNGVTFKMIAVEGGTFTMGATAEQGSDAYTNERPTHQVTLSSYSIGETEVTQALWQAVMGTNPSQFAGNLERPVEKVSWNACQAFISKLNQMTSKHFRLPTEAEWEFAARGGNLSQGYKYPGSNDVTEVAWFRDNSYAVGSSSPDYGTHPVGTLAPNELGIYDMSGNVSEWCQDLFGNYSSAAQTNPTGSTTSTHRVYRGGSWGVNARYCRVSYRLNYTPTGISSNYGLRLVLDEENSPKFRLLETVVEIEVGGSVTVDILNGSGSYSVTGGATVVTAAIDGETVTVTGVAKGTNTVYVTDNATGATAVLAVIVNESNVET